MVNTGLDRRAVDALDSAGKSQMHRVQTKELDAPPDAEHRMIQNLKPWTISRWSELNLVKVKPLVWILMEDAHLVGIKRTEGEKAKRQTLVGRIHFTGCYRSMEGTYMASGMFLI